MERLLVKAVVEAATDQGVFEAVVSTGSVDRQGDIVDPAGMLRAFERWAAVGRPVPLAWDHGRSAEDQIGSVNPSTARIVNGEVVIQGQVDLDTAVGQTAWRAVKRGTLGLSFGYAPIKSTPRHGGGRHLTELDLIECTLTAAPANPDTRVLGVKSLEEEEVFGLNRRAERKAVDHWMSAYSESAPLFMELLRFTKRVGHDPYRQDEPRRTLEQLSEDERAQLWGELQQGIEERQQAVEMERLEASGTFHRLPSHERRLVIAPSGAIVDAAENELLARQEQTREHGRAAEAEARRSMRADRAESRDSAEVAAVEEIRRLTPPGVWRPPAS